MVIDRTHRKWALAVGVTTLCAALGYVPYHFISTHGPSGGSWPGLAYGIGGFAMMLAAGLLGLRRRFPLWRVGRLQGWMRAHLWLGVLALPLVLFHSGFSLGRGTLTSVLMLLLLVVTASGVFGAAMQHFMPRVMTTQVPMETVYAEIESVRAGLRAEAEKLVAPPAPAKPAAVAAAAGVEAEGGAITQVSTPVRNHREVLREFYDSSLKPLLEGRSADLRDSRMLRVEFERVRKLVPVEAHDVLADLEEICDEDRQLLRQKRLHRWLHYWLFVHVPLSYALLLLGAAHAVMALRY